MSQTFLSREAEGRDAQAEQALVEHQILQHVVSALRLSLEWPASAVGLDAKLSSVRFIAQSFQRHLARVLSLEESGGYLPFVREERPGLYHKVKELRREHDDFRRSLSEIMASLDAQSAGDVDQFNETCRQLDALLAALDRHHAREVDLIQEAMCDVGGEG